MTTRKPKPTPAPEADPGRPIRQLTESIGEYTARLQDYTARRDAALRSSGGDA